MSDYGDEDEIALMCELEEVPCMTNALSMLKATSAADRALLIESVKIAAAERLRKEEEERRQKEDAAAKVAAQRKKDAAGHKLSLNGLASSMLGAPLSSGPSLSSSTSKLSFNVGSLLALDPPSMPASHAVSDRGAKRRTISETELKEARLAAAAPPAPASVPSKDSRPEVKEAKKPAEEAQNPKNPRDGKKPAEYPDVKIKKKDAGSLRNVKEDATDLKDSRRGTDAGDVKVERQESRDAKDDPKERKKDARLRDEPKARGKEVKESKESKQIKNSDERRDTKSRDISKEIKGKDSAKGEHGKEDLPKAAGDAVPAAEPENASAGSGKAGKSQSLHTKMEAQKAQKMEARKAEADKKRGRPKKPESDEDSDIFSASSDSAHEDSAPRPKSAENAKRPGRPPGKKSVASRGA
jgi:hypothetical protein